MRLTIFTDYALRVLIYLGAHRDSERLSTISDIATAYAISQNHLMKVVHQLGKLGYVQTTRGKDGGMQLARAPGEINLGAVVRATEEDLALVECFQEGPPKCPIVHACALQGILARSLHAFLDVLDGHTLADLLQPRTELMNIYGGANGSRARLRTPGR
jgi:Rrf2 family transcriptional regulator, nitric oxide-sensitive transcriptional repressor